EDILATIVRIRAASGRAPFSRQVMDRATEEIFSGKDPRQEGGALFEDEEIRKKLVCQPIDKQTNNHLIRHRLLILRRLLKSLIRRYAGADKRRVRAVVVEVDRDIHEYACLTAKEKAQLLGSKLSQHRRVATKLATDLHLSGVDAAVSGRLIRKASI